MVWVDCDPTHVAPYWRICDSVGTAYCTLALMIRAPHCTGAVTHWCISSSTKSEWISAARCFQFCLVIYFIDDWCGRVQLSSGLSDAFDVYLMLNDSSAAAGDESWCVRLCVSLLTDVDTGISGTGARFSKLLKLNLGLRFSLKNSRKT